MRTKLASWLIRRKIKRILRQLFSFMRKDKSMSKVLDFLRSVLPFLKQLAALTSTPADDEVLAIIAMLLANPSQAGAVKAHMESKGMKP